MIDIQEATFTLPSIEAKGERIQTLVHHFLKEFVGSFLL